jgi:hypothetical protein
VLFESASGYTLFEVVESEEIAKLKAEVQASVTDLARFSKLVKLTAFQPYTSAENALQNINDVSEGIVNEDLKNFLEAQMPKVKPGKTAKFVLGACASLVLPGHGQAGAASARVGCCGCCSDRLWAASRPQEVDTSAAYRPTRAIWPTPHGT